MHLLASIWLSSGIKRFSLPRSIESAQRTNCVPNNAIIVKLGIMHSTGWYWHTNRGGIYRIPSHHVYCDNYLEFSTVQLVRKLRDHVRVGHDKKTKICWVKSDHFKVTWSSASTKTNTNFCLLYMALSLFRTTKMDPMHLLCTNLVLPVSWTMQWILIFSSTVIHVELQWSPIL